MAKRSSAAGKTVAVKDLCDFENGHGFSPSDWSDAGLPIIRIQNLNGSDRFNHFAGLPDPRWIVEPGDLLFAWAGVKGVSFGATVWPGPRGVLNQHIYRLRPKGDVNKSWLCHALQWVTLRIEQKAHGFKSSLMHVRKADIDSQLLCLPSLEKQREFAVVLDCVDTSIELAEQQLGLLEVRMSALAEVLFGRADKKTKSPLSQLFERVVRKNTASCHRTLTISGRAGLIDQAEYFDKSIASKQNDHYLLLRRGEFAYNRSFSQGYPFGAIKQLERYDEGIVSTLYLCFALRPDAPLDADYCRDFFESGALNPQLRRVTQAGARAHGLLNVTADDFMRLQMPVPSLERQREVVGILDTARRETQAAEALLGRLKQQKRSLMQRLFSGAPTPILSGS